MKNAGSFLMFFLAVFVSCAPSQTISVATETSDIPTQTATLTTVPTLTPIPPTPTPVKQSAICSPLEGETLASLQEIITQPFKQPRPGQDDGHHGVDFAHYRRNDLLSIDGVAIQSVLYGEVVTIIKDKYPYGNALIIETSLDSIAPELLALIMPPEIAPTVIPDPKFNWAPTDLPFELSESSRSLYIYYAHLKFLPEVEIGQKVTCGQRIGQVGTTGDSTNPHLHFETRIGPSGARFESMAYYITQSTETERYNYIMWRISNLFQIFDPMQVLDIKK